MNMTIKSRLAARLAPRFIGVAICALVALPCLAFGQWVPLGPYGSGIQVLTSLPAEPRVLIAATRNALIYRSSDKGVTWRPVTFPRSLQATLNSLIPDPCDSSTIYVGVSDSNDAPGLYKSMNGGASWT